MPGAFIPQKTVYIIPSIWKNIPSPTFLTNLTHPSYFISVITPSEMCPLSSSRLTLSISSCDLKKLATVFLTGLYVKENESFFTHQRTLCF